ncbi:MAG: Mfa1 family fimbria major subunit [Bacteroidaceae bacterium]|nr:Mfa1 family fimbria major subunit [Bacteroidaceae bacterium]
MKKSFILGFIAALAFSACSNEDGLTTDGGVNGNGGEQKFLTVNIVSTAASRAAGDQLTGDPNENATYEEGTERENKVTSVRFFFFTPDGSAAKVLAGKDVNYLDWDAPTGTGADMPNVEKALDATLVINTKKGDQIPAKIVAVLNPTSDFKTETNNKATRLRKLSTTSTAKTIDVFTRDYAALANRQNSASFVMYNSIYANGETVVDATDIPAAAFQSSEELAKKNPVNIYVERMVAKVRVRLSESTGNGTEEKLTFTTLKDGTKGIVLKNKDKKIIKVGDKQVYLRLSDWFVTADRKENYLSKHISTDWASDLFGAEKWNWSAYFRSYWAINSNPDGTAEKTQNYYSFNHIVTNGKNYDDGYYYTNENAPQKAAVATNVSGASVEPFTKVIMAGELVDEDGETIELCKYAGLTMAGMDNLKTALLAQLRSTGGMIYSVANDDDGDVSTTTFTDLTEYDVTFTTALESNDAKEDTSVDESEQTSGRYFVYLTLSDTGAGKTWTKDNDPTTKNREIMTIAEVNSYFYEQIGRCSVYSEGKTYYFFPIRHLGESGKPGYYGVVRNHIYDCNITNIVGLGTPVYDPDETIWPETTVEEHSYIAAKINILSWRVVPNDYELQW